jgi:hypothetical protein
MKHVLSTLLLASASWMAQAATVETELFSIDIPTRWTVENNEANIIFAFGDRVVEGNPAPQLSVLHCSNDPSAKEKGMSFCKKTCSEEASDIERDSVTGDPPLPPTVRTIHKNDGSSQFTHELAVTPSITVSTALSCNKKGQVLLRLTSDQPMEIARKQFFEILASLHWE